MNSLLPPAFADRSVFLVWGPPGHGPRSKVFSRTLGIPIEFISGTRIRGGVVAPYKYVYQTVATIRMMRRRRPLLVFIQSPPSLAAPVVWLSGRRYGTRFVIDAHSDAMMSPIWTRPKFLHRFLARKAVTTIVTNEHFAAEIQSWGAHATIIRDIPTAFPSGDSVEPNPDSFLVMVVNTFASDEPLDAILSAAKGLGDVEFRITGDPRRPGVSLPATLPDNVVFTGFLPDDEYFGLMASADAVMCLTTRDHTMQRGACEALSMGVPIITSNWPLLRDYFSAGTVHTDAGIADIEAGIRAMREDHGRYLTEIGELQHKQHQEWDLAMQTLLLRLGDDGGSKQIHGGATTS